MVLARNIFFICAMFTFVILLMAMLPVELWEPAPKSYPVYQPYEDFHGDIVNFMIGESFSFAIKKVQFTPETLAVDFMILDLSPHSLEKMYQDILKLIVDGFAQFSTVSDIRTRMLMQNEKGERLLIAVLALRNQYEANPIAADAPVDVIIEHLQRNFIVTYGPAWINAN